MAKIVLVCLRDHAGEPAIQMRRRMHAFLASLCPDNLKPNPPAIATDLNGLWLGVYNPAEKRSIHECSAYAGWFAQPKARWWSIGAPTPSGSHAVFRGGKSAVEVLADHAGSRAVWVAMTDRIFVASTTQRAIPYFLGSFQPNPEAQAWMLSSGTLGPRGGWDRRAKRLGPAGAVRLDRARWQLTTREPPLTLSPESASDETFVERLNAGLGAVLSNLEIDFSRWVLPLSGGYDSRAILLMSAQRRELRTVTWGSSAARARKGNDAQVAPRVAARLKVPNTYLETNLSEESVDRIMRRFLQAGDGCTDGLNAYVDGFGIWRKLFEAGVRGIIRGDQVFGLTPGPVPRADADVYACVGLTAWKDLEGAPTLAQLGLKHLDCQRLPRTLARMTGESRLTWRDRLYQAFRLHVYMAGQHDLKSAYVEIANPLLSKELLEIARTQPQHLRTGKELFQRVIAPHDIDVAYAIESALVSPCDFTEMPKVRAWLHAELGGSSIRRHFGDTFAGFLDGTLDTVTKRSGVAKLGKRVRQHARMLLPEEVRSWVPRQPRRVAFAPKWVAVRAWLAARMLDRLAADARHGAHAHLDALPSLISAAG